ncbi:hypothetical protein WJX74_009994 [Apatococcus lobatus]|uniref:Uncharacterized protein n=2 Tax=Apatococcus TaxID=904362 RepID=A0AAW1RF65_9CHLO
MRSPTFRICLVSLSLLACLTSSVVGRRDLQQAAAPAPGSYPPCGSDDGPLSLDTSQLAFAQLTSGQSLSFYCGKLFDGYSRGCTSNSVYTYVYQAVGPPPHYYNSEQYPSAPYVSVYAKPSDTALEVKQELYHLDLKTGSIFVALPGTETTVPFNYPHFHEFPLYIDPKTGLPADGGCVRDGTADAPCATTGYSFHLNEMRSAIQNVTSAPVGDPAFACNPPQSELSGLLQYFYEIQGTSADNALPLGPPLATGPIPAGDVPQW